VKIEDIKQAYEKATSERERAVLELRCWDLHGEEARKRHVRCSDFLQGVLGSPSKPDIDHRLFLLRLGSLADPLWPLVDGEMKIQTATLIARRAKLLRRMSPDETSAIGRAISEYERLPNKKSLGGGKFIRVRRAKRRKKSAPAPVKESRPVPKERSAEPRGRPPSGDAVTFRAKVRELVKESLAERLQGVDEIVIQAQMERFEIDLKLLLEEFEDRVHEKRRNHVKVVQHFKRRDLIAACEVLHLVPPRVVDAEFEKIAKRNFKELARQYHTDVSGTSSTQPAFDAVMKAWKVIQTFGTKGN